MKAFYCAGTHWDREWYEPFQEFRRWLVELVDELMDLMEKDPEYRCFHLDGQTVVLEDYLEIRPERREELLRLLRGGRLLAGPWYNLPDEWLISGESFIRNLARGLRVCRELDVPALDFAYTPDQFGHVAALPMIMRGFGFSAGICWRGTQDETFPAHFAWVGPDGGRMAYHKLCDKGSYSPFEFAVRRPVKDGGYRDEDVDTHFVPFFDEESARSSVPMVLMLDAIDHQRPDPKMPWLFAALREKHPEITFEWGSLADYGRALAAHLDELPERRGELREPARDNRRVGQYLIVHTISSRYDLKRKNDLGQALLEKWAEPLLLMETLDGGKPVPGFLDKAWQYLLRNHPHDSICGCSIDQVHRDMHYRFDQAALLAGGIIRRACARLGGASAAADDWARVAAHNPLPYARRGVFDLTLYFPADYAEKTGNAYIDSLAWGERYNKFDLVAPGGERIPYQHVRVERNIECRRVDANGREQTVMGDLYHVAAELDLPPCGHATFRIETTPEATRTFGSLLTGPLRAENAHLAFELFPDGTGALTRKADGEVFPNLFLYEDCGECGDGWTRGQLLNDIVYRGPGAQVMTAVDEDGPLRTVFRVERTRLLPDEMDRRTGWRSERRAPLMVTDYISVEKDCPVLKVRTVVDNTVRDHRLRVLFPTLIETDTSFADTPFAVVERDIAIPPETARWQERVNPETAFTSFFGVKDAQGGLAVVSGGGLHECAVLETPESCLALTLFRSFRKTVMRPEQPDGQLQGRLEFSYALYPFEGAFDPRAALRQADLLAVGVFAHTAAPGAPERRSFLGQTGGGAVMTAMKPADDGNGGVVRFWNPTGADVVDGFRTEAALDTAFLCNLNEEPGAELPVRDGAVAVTVPAGGLATVRFTWKPKG